MKVRACPEWEKYLSCTHSEDLSPLEQAALNAHIATCSLCSHARASFIETDELLRNLPHVKPLPHLPVMSIQRKKGKDSKVSVLLVLSKSKERFVEGRTKQERILTPEAASRGFWQRALDYTLSLAAVISLILISSLLFHQYPQTTVGGTLTISSTVHSTTVPTRENSTAAATVTAYNGILMVGPNHQSDQLLSSNRGFNWDTVDISSGAECTYTQGTYHAGDTLSGNFSACFEHQYNLTDFSYQVNMKILQGDSGGVAFRADPVVGTFYYFSIDTHGNYALVLVDSFTPGPVLPHGFSAAIHAGLNQTNQIAVIAKSNSIMVYVNMQLVVQVTDSTKAGGYIGVVGQDVNNSTSVSFSDAQIWY